MQLEPKVFLPIAEKAGAICTWDSEATGLKGDYNSLLVVSVQPYSGKVKTFVANKPGDDKALCKAAKEELEKYAMWISYYGRGYDIKMLNTRLLYHGMMPVEPRLHLDLYFSLKAKLLTARRSQAHLLEWLNTPQKKMTLSAEEWNAILSNYKKHLPTMRARCESDVQGLENLYDRTKHLLKDVTR